MTNGKILKINTLPIVLFTNASVNLIKKSFWLISKKILTWKDIAVDIIKLLEDSDPLSAAPELNERLQRKVFDQMKPVRNTIKCQVNFSVHLLWKIYILQIHTFMQITALCSFEKSQNFISFIEYPCLLKVREVTVAEGNKFQKEVKNVLNGDFARWVFKN